MSTTETETPTLAALAASLGLTLTASAPRAHIEPQWRAIAYDCVLLRNSKPVWEGEYKLGVGHVKPGHWKRAKSILGTTQYFRPHESVIRTLAENPNAMLADHNAHVRAAVAVAGKFGIKPALEDVLSSLVMDNPNDMSFEEWCADFGYDSDSRKAHAIWEACCEVGRKLRRAFTPEELTKLTDAATNY